MDKCLPFRASISCSHFQRFSDALCHLIHHKLELRRKRRITNYLDDYLFIAHTLAYCNYMIDSFLKLCSQLGVPVSMDKTEWASDKIVFLGILLDGHYLSLAIPEDKRIKAVELLSEMIGQKKTMVKKLQQLCGFLNFLGKAIFLGRTFSRRMYAKFNHLVNVGDANQRRNSHDFKWKQHYHIRLDQEFKLDCQIWMEFLTGSLGTVANRPMIDLSVVQTSMEIGFTSDASASQEFGYGFGATLGTRWILGAWPRDFVKNEKPSIEYLELFALVAGVLTWQSDRCLCNARISVHCDNIAVVHMVNNLTSSCGNYMFLIRLLTLNSLKFNHRITALYISSKNNFLSDALSRNQISKFRTLGPQINKESDQIDPTIWPISKVWESYTNCETKSGKH